MLHSNSDLTDPLTTATSADAPETTETAATAQTSQRDDQEMNNSAQQQQQQRSLFDRIRLQRERQDAPLMTTTNSTTTSTSEGTGHESNDFQEGNEAAFRDQINRAEVTRSEPDPLRVPQYQGEMDNNFAGPPMPSHRISDANNVGIAGGAANFFTNAWHNIQHSMETGMAQHQQQEPAGDWFSSAGWGRNGTDSTDALLSSVHHDMEQEDAENAPMSGQRRRGHHDYSMSRYFMTMVKDVYDLFQSLPVWARWVVALILLYIALRLL